MISGRILQEIMDAGRDYLLDEISWFRKHAN